MKIFASYHYQGKKESGVGNVIGDVEKRDGETWSEFIRGIENYIEVTTPKVEKAAIINFKILEE